MRTRSRWFRPSFRSLVALVAACSSVAWAVRVVTEDFDVSKRAEMIVSRDRDERLSGLLDLSILVGSNARHGKAAWPLVLRATDDPDPYVRAQALITLSDLAGSYQMLGLGHQDYAQARRITLMRLDDPSPEVRAAAIGSLGRLGPIEANALPALTRLSREPEFMLTRASAFEQLGRFDHSVRGAHAAVLTGLTDNEPFVRASAVQSLGTWVDVDAATARTVVERLNDDDRRVRYAAYEALRALTPPRSELLPTLRNLISDEEVINARIGAELAARMGRQGRSLAPLLWAAHQRHRESLPESAFIMTLAVVAPESEEARRAIEQLKSLLDSPDARGKSAAAQALAAFEAASSALPALQDAAAINNEGEK